MLSNGKQWFIADRDQYYNSLFFSLYGVETIKDHITFEVFNELMIWKKKMMGASVNFDTFVNNLLESSLDIIKRSVVCKIAVMFRPEIGSKLKTFWKQIRNRSYLKQREAMLAHIVEKIHQLTKNDVLIFFNRTNASYEYEKNDTTSTVWTMTSANINEYKASKSNAVTKETKSRSRSFIIKGKLQCLIIDERLPL
eukprot:533366_1